MVRYSVIFVLLIFSLWGNAHPLHLSITNIDKKDDSLQISIRLFKDDFSTAINQLFVFTDKNTDSLLPPPHLAINYLLAHFELTTDRQNCELSFSHQQHDELSVWYFFSCAFPNNWNQILLKNTLLTDIFNDQKNLVIVNLNNTEQGFEFDAKTSQITILQKTAETYVE